MLQRAEFYILCCRGDTLYPFFIAQLSQNYIDHVYSSRSYVLSIFICPLYRDRTLFSRVNAA